MNLDEKGLEQKLLNKAQMDNVHRENKEGESKKRREEKIKDLSTVVCAPQMKSRLNRSLFFSQTRLQTLRGWDTLLKSIMLYSLEKRRPEKTDQLNSSSRKKITRWATPPQVQALVHLKKVEAELEKKNRPTKLLRKIFKRTWLRRRTAIRESFKNRTGAFRSNFLRMFETPAGSFPCSLGAGK